MLKRTKKIRKISEKKQDVKDKNANFISFVDIEH
jgi:hypothetical protein